jgi:predicted DCC family thiol-disulfide oxidoreductase YuxK
VAAAGWILYDDACGICRRWVPFWQRTLSNRGFSIAPLQTDWVRAELGLDGADLTQDLRLLLADGGQIQGADVYRHVMRAIWWAYPLYVLSTLPILRTVFDWGYRTFAENRHRISDACRLPANSAR